MNPLDHAFEIFKTIDHATVVFSQEWYVETEESLCNFAADVEYDCSVGEVYRYGELQRSLGFHNSREDVDFDIFYDEINSIKVTHEGITLHIGNFLDGKPHNIEVYEVGGA